MSEGQIDSDKSSNYFEEDDDEEEVNQDEADDEENSSENGWVQWYCSLEGHEFLAEVSEDYLKDTSNHYGLKSKFPNFSDCLYQIIAGGVPAEEDLQDEQYLEMYQSLTDLYGLIHARFILTPLGLTIMREKYLIGKFGVCSRVLCERHNVIPIGMSNDIKTSRVKVFCPRCQEVYYPKDKNNELDGGYFGTSFPHVLLQTFPFLYPLQEFHQYVPKISGFKVHNGRGIYAEKIDTKYRINL